LFRAMKLAPLSRELWQLFFRALFARPARAAGESR